MNHYCLSIGEKELELAQVGLIFLRLPPHSGFQMEKSFERHKSRQRGLGWVLMDK